MLRGVLGSGGGAAIGGGGTSSPSTIPRWTGPSTLGDSVITQDTATGVNIRVNAASSVYALANRTAVEINGTSFALLGFQVGGVASGFVDASASFMRVSAGLGRTLGLGANSVTGMTFDTSNNVGIGTASPATLLNIRGASPTFAIDDTATGTSAISFRPNAASYAERAAWTVLYGTAESRISAGAAGGSYFQTFYTNGTERARIDSNGNVGIGTASPATKLEVVAGTAIPARFATNNGTACVVRLLQSGQREWGIQIPASGTSLSFYDYSAAQERMVIDVNGNVILGTATGATIQAAGLQQGIKLAPSTAASFNTDPNTLDCYQEGTWSPTLTGFGGTTPTVTSARYTRVGRMVLLEVSINATGGATYSGTRAATYLSLPAGMVPPTISAAGAMTDSGINTLGTAVAYYNGNLYLPTFAATAVNTFVTVSYSI